MSNFKKIIEVLNDLIKINKDREEGYVKAGRELTPAEHNLRGIFERKALESRNNVMQLQHKAEEIGVTEEKEVEDGGSFTGVLYSIWTDLKNVFTADKEQSLLESCATGEKAAQECYRHALEQPELPEDITHLIKEQKQSIDASREEIVRLLSN